jgi:C6 transcription factor Pro1
MELLINGYFLQVFRGGNNDWQTHLQAARALFVEIKDSFTMPVGHVDSRQAAQTSIQRQHRERHGTADLASLSPDEVLALDFFASALVWFDILSSATTGSKPEYPDVFSSLLHIEDGRIQLCKLMGCKNWAMVVIMDIATLAEWKSLGQRRGNLSLRELARRAASIEERLKAGIVENLKRPLDPQIDPCGVRSLESQYVTHVFACAAQTYLHVVLSGAYPEISEIKESVTATIKAFRSLPDVRWVRHLVWPFCIAGCMAAEEYEDDFRHIASTANMDGEVFGNFDKASAIMEECWRGRRRQKSSPWCWTTAMASLGLKVLLI